MSIAELRATVQELATPGKGILAADESTKTIAKRLATIGVDSTETARRDYREMLFTTPELNQYISGVILYEETLGQKSTSGITLGEVLSQQGIIPGIKVDKGLVNLPNSVSEKVTQGLDGLADRLQTYKEMGARFAKWRAVFDVADITPSTFAIKANAHALARYAGFCQEAGIVPIVEPEVLMNGDHTIGRCKVVTQEVLYRVFHELHQQNIKMEGMILKPSMVISGMECPQQAPVEDVASATLDVLLRTVPAAVPSINFLSGGQSAELATAHLDAMNKMQEHLPWYLSFSYGRALQAPSLEAWHGKAENVAVAQQALQKRAKLNGAAAVGEYDAGME